ncbi:cysteine protease [Nannochloropsis oceanica]
MLLLRSAILLSCLFAAASAAITTATTEEQRLQQHKHKHRRGWVLHGHEVAEEEWSRFKRYFRKVYFSSAEESYRFSVFRSSLAQAKLRNAHNVAAGGEHVFGVTRFSDETQEEFDRRYKGRKSHGKGVRKGVAIRRPLAWTSARMEREGEEEGGKEGGGPVQKRPAMVDWVEAGATTSVANQGQCGSCWAFSATSQIESAFIMDGNAPWRLSVQQVTSCTANGFGCGGGDTIEAYEQLLGGETKTGMQTPGLVSAAMAPYVESMYEECLSPRCTEKCRNRQIGNLTKAEEYEALTGFYVSIAGWSYGTPPCDDACDAQDLDLLKANVAEYGPASICVNAESWGLYVEGVLMTEACGSYAYDSLDHCVNIVGYNDNAPEPYFVVRNSWSTLWGMDGHIRLSSRNNTCGLANEVTFVSIAPEEEEEGGRMREGGGDGDREGRGDN